MIPARDVGGDFYDFFLLGPSRLGVVIADVSGKGIPAALFMAVSRTLTKAAALTASSPAACLRQVNVLLNAENRADMFVSLFYGVLDTDSGRLVFSNATGATTHRSWSRTGAAHNLSGKSPDACSGFSPTRSTKMQAAFCTRGRPCCSIPTGSPRP
jgi:hypothetical protein